MPIDDTYGREVQERGRTRAVSRVDPKLCRPVCLLPLRRPHNLQYLIARHPRPHAFQILSAQGRRIGAPAQQEEYQETT